MGWYWFLCSVFNLLAFWLVDLTVRVKNDLFILFMGLFSFIVIMRIIGSLSFVNLCYAFR